VKDLVPSRLVIALFAVTALLGLAAPLASADNGELTLYGYVYTSDGSTLVLDDSDCQAAPAPCHATIAVNVSVDSGFKEFETSILDGSLYSITLGSDGWAPGASYRIKVNGEPWHDVNYFASDVNGAVDVTEFAFPTDPAQMGSVRRDLRAAASLPPPVEQLPNWKPVLASVFGVVLLVTGFLFIIYLPRQRVAVEFTGKSKIMEQDAKGQQVTFYRYDCSYVTPTGNLPIGEIVHSEEDVDLFQTREVSVSRILKNPDGSYAWYDPRVVPFKDKAKQLKELVPGEGMKVHTLEGKLLETMDAAKLEAYWRAGGKVALHTGQDAKSAVMQKKRDLFLTFALPPAVIEFLLGGVSAATGALAVPATTEGWVVNSAILAVGVLSHVVLLILPNRPKTPEQGAPAAPATSAPAEPPAAPSPEEMPPPDQAPPPGEFPPPP
jgi:hypothetical protein